MRLTWWAATVSTDEGGHAAGARARAESADLADRPPEEPGDFGHQQLAAIKGMETFKHCSARWINVIMPPDVRLCRGRTFALIC